MDVEKIRSLIYEAETPAGKVYKDAYRLECRSVSGLAFAVVQCAFVACHAALHEATAMERKILDALRFNRRAEWLRLCKAMETSSAFACGRVRVFAEIRAEGEIYEEDLIAEFPDGLAVFAMCAMPPDLARDVLKSINSREGRALVACLSDEAGITDVQPAAPDPDGFEAARKALEKALRENHASDSRAETQVNTEGSENAVSVH